MAQSGPACARRGESSEVSGPVRGGMKAMERQASKWSGWGRTCQPEVSERFLWLHYKRCIPWA